MRLDRFMCVWHIFWKPEWQWWLAHNLEAILVVVLPVGTLAIIAVAFHTASRLLETTASAAAACSCLLLIMTRRHLLFYAATWRHKGKRHLRQRTLRDHCNHSHAAEESTAGFLPQTWTSYWRKLHVQYRTSTNLPATLPSSKLNSTIFVAANFC